MTEKNKGGRPLRFKTVEQLEKEVDAYFAETPEKRWTMTGLCMVLDIDYTTLISYGEKDEYSKPIKKARMKVHNSYEADLREKGRSGDIFALKNFGWRDKQETEMKVDGGVVILPERNKS